MINHIEPGEELTPERISEVTRGLEATLNKFISGLGGEGSLSDTRAQFSQEVEVGNWVYYDDATQTYRPALARMEMRGSSATPAQSSVVHGVVTDLLPGRTGTVVFGGRITEVTAGGGTSFAARTLEPGLSWMHGVTYWLSEAYPGKMTHRHTSMGVMVARASLDSFQIAINMGSPFVNPTTRKLEVATRPAGGLRRLEDRSVVQRVVAYDGLERDGSVWKSTKDSSNAVIRNNGWVSAEVDVIQEAVTKIPCVIVIHNAAGSQDLKISYAKDLGSYNRGESYHEQTIENLDRSAAQSGDITNPAGETMAVMRFRFTSTDVSAERIAVLRYPESFVGWRQLIQPSYETGNPDYFGFLHRREGVGEIVPTELTPYTDAFQLSNLGEPPVIPETPVFHTPQDLAYKDDVDVIENGVLPDLRMYRVTNTEIPGPTGSVGGVMEVGGEEYTIVARHGTHDVVVDMTGKPEITNTSAAITVDGTEEVEALLASGPSGIHFWRALAMTTSIGQYAVDALVRLYTNTGHDGWSGVQADSYPSELRVYAVASPRVIVLNAQSLPIPRTYRIQLFLRPYYWYNSRADLSFRANWVIYDPQGVTPIYNGVELTAGLLNETNGEIQPRDAEIGFGRFTLFWMSKDGETSPWDFDSTELVPTGIIDPISEEQELRLSGDVVGIMWEPVAARAGRISRMQVYTTEFQRRLSSGTISQLEPGDASVAIGSTIMNGGSVRLYLNRTGRPAAVREVKIYIEELIGDTEVHPSVSLGTQGGSSFGIGLPYRDILSLSILNVYRRRQVITLRPAAGEDYTAIRPGQELRLTVNNAARIIQASGKAGTIVANAYTTIDLL